MKPDFALLLSMEGIQLLARAAGGWRLAGAVSLDAADLEGDLAALRETAVALGGPAFRTKLIVPNDQLRYLSVDTGHVSTADRIDQVRQALDGATPYAVEDLVYDICVDGPMTHVAAVARETLREAESFAMEHRFHPISCVATPGEDAAYLGEPFFGPTGFSETALTPGERVEPDGVAVVVIGPLEDAPVPEATPVSEAAPEPPAPSEPAPTVAAPGAAAPDPEAGPVPTFTATPRIPAAPPPLEDTPGLAEPEPPAFGFASRRAAAAPEPPVRRTSTIAPHIDDEAEEPQPDTAEVPPPAQSGADTWASRFLTRRGAEDGARSTPAAIPPVPRPIRPEPVPPPRPLVTANPRPVASGFEPADAIDDERHRLTIFGMRNQDDTPGPPRHMGLILTGVLLIFLAGVAAWASVFLDNGLSSLFDQPEPVRAAQVPRPAEETTEASAEPGLSDTDAAVLDALRAPQDSAESGTWADTLLEPEVEPEPEGPTTQTRYAVTGIWERAPEPPAAPGILSLDDLYQTSIDAVLDARDAVALPALASFDTDLPLRAMPSPIAPGTQFELDAAGRVVPTADGALSPDGFTVFIGRPPLIPPPTPTRFAVTPEPDAVTQAIITARPRLRPGDLVEQTERTQLGGLTRQELAAVRPRLRPETEKTEQETDQTPTAQAVAQSRPPRPRPDNIDQLVASVQRAVASAPASNAGAGSAAAVVTPTAPTPVAAAPATVTPRIPSSASVSRAATQENAMNLRRVNLIGVYGTPANRRALVRMPNGRYKKVQVGDRLDGGRISAIGDSELRYQKGGRNLTLTIPSG